MYFCGELWNHNIFQQDDDSSNSKSEHSDLEIDNSINNLKNIQSYQCWLPAIPPSTNYHCNALPTSVDMQCNVYFQNIDDGMKNKYNQKIVLIIYFNLNI